MFRRDGRGAAMVTAELAGRYEAPIHGLFEVNRAIGAFDWARAGLAKPEVLLNGQSPCSAFMCWSSASSAASPSRW